MKRKGRFLFEDREPVCCHCGIPWATFRAWEEGTAEEQRLLIEHKAEACCCAKCLIAAGEKPKINYSTNDWQKMGLTPPGKRDPKKDIDWDDSEAVELG